MDSPQPAEVNPPAVNALEHVIVPEIIDVDSIRTVFGPSIDKVIAQADAMTAKLAAGIKDDESMALAVGAAESLRDNGQDLLKKWREDFYIPEMRRVEDLRDVFDPRLKRIAAHIKTLMGYVSDYKIRKEREARLVKERADSEAKRLRDEAERVAREAEEAERRRLQAIEDEKKRKADAEAAEARRVQAEKDLKERLEREAREAAAAETRRKLAEEEIARIRHAEVARDEGNGAEKVDTILESATPISPVLAKSEQSPDLETLRLEKESAERVALERALNEAHDAAASEEARRAAEAEAKRLKDDAARAAATATAAAAAAAAVSVVPDKVDTGTTSTTRWKYDLDSDGTENGDIEAVMKILKAILDGVVPIEYCGYDRKRPQDFRPPIIQKDVTDKKDRFACPGVKAFPQQDEQLKRRVVGGRR